LDILNCYFATSLMDQGRSNGSFG